MKQTGPNLYVTFHTTSAAMAAERVCREAGVPGKLVPVPRTLTSDCGISWRTEPELRGQLETLLARAGVEFAAMAEICA